MDYDKPGSVQVCGSCGHFSDAPKVGFVCLDCGAHTDAEEMPNRDWHHYELTPLGRQSVHAGRLLGRSVQAPASQASAGSDGVEALPSQMVSPATLAEMLNLLEGVRQRSGRASTALELALATVPNGEKPRSRLESLTAKAVGELASEMLRPGDVMSTCPSGLLVLCPETKPREAEKLARRVGDHLRRNLTQDVVQGVRIMSSGDARELLPGGP